MDAATARQLQLQLRAVTLRQVLALWPLWRPEESTSFAAFVAAMVPLLKARHRDSAALAARFYREARKSAGVRGTVTPALAEFNTDKAVSSLYVTGEVMTGKALQAGMSVEAARANALVRVSGAASRLVLDGGRETLKQAGMADKAQRGWARETGGSPCDWCSDAAAAADGGDYAMAFGGHDHCACVPAPRF